MNPIQVYSQYFSADCIFNGTQRNGVQVFLIAESGEGMIAYKVKLVFFPHVDEYDYAVTYDCVLEKELYSAKGRRSKKREAVFLEQFRSIADELAQEVQGTILWEKPLRDARYA